MSEEETSAHHRRPAHRVRWQPPQLRVGHDREEHRQATWLEMFFDLVFVVVVAELANNLSRDVSMRGFAEFVLLFLPVWWAWMGAAFYSTRFDSDDLSHRLHTALQILAVAAMAANVHGGLRETSQGFALCYAAVRAILVHQYLRAGRAIPRARPLTNRYARGFGIAVILWVASVFVPIPWRFALWAAAMAIDFGTPMLAGRLHSSLAPHSIHLPERFGLFTLIVLGNAVASVIYGARTRAWGPWSILAASLGVVIAFCIWWVYFDNLNGNAIRKARTQGRIASYQIWMYAHLPLVIGITMAGVGLQRILSASPGTSGDAARWLMCGGVAAAQVALGAIHIATETERHPTWYASGWIFRFAGGASIVVVGLWGGDLRPAAVVGLLALVCLAQVLVDVPEHHHPATGD